MSSLWTDALSNEIPDLTDAGIEAFFSCSSTSDVTSPTHVPIMNSSSIGSSQDSVTERRRHAIYFHRPPVWWSNTDPASHLTASGDCKMCMLSGQGICSHCESRLSYSPFDRQSGSFSSTIDQEDELCWEVQAANADLLASFGSSISESDQGAPLLVGFLTSSKRGHVTLTPRKGRLEESRVRQMVRFASERDGNQVTTIQNSS